jgi:hypothetical protein
MKKKNFIIILLSMLVFSSCGNPSQDVNRLIKEGYVLQVEFDANGGTIGNYTSRLIRCQENSLILAPGDASIPSAVKVGYTLDGWYTYSIDDTGNIVYENKWDFQKDYVVEDLKLIAKWVSYYQVKYFYGEDFASSSTFLELPSEDDLVTTPSTYYLAGNTIIGYYLDQEMTIPFTFEQKVSAYPITDDKIIAIYVKMLEGKYNLIYNASQLSKINASANYYLMNDIDMKSSAISIPSTYAGIFDGNNHTLSNITIDKVQKGDDYFALFTRLNNATIKNITFDNLTYNLELGGKKSQVALISAKVTSSTLENITLKNSTLNITLDGVSEDYALSSIFCRNIDEESQIIDCEYDQEIYNNKINYLNTSKEENI